MCDYCDGLINTDHVCEGCGYDYSDHVTSGEYSFDPSELICVDCRRVGRHAEGC